MERKRTGRLLAAFVVALVATLGLVFGASTTAYAKDAKEYTTLSVGDVLHVGDTINSETAYLPSSETSLYTSGMPWTLVRCDIDTTKEPGEQVAESNSGPYYAFKDRTGDYTIYGSDLGGVHGAFYATTATSDGIYVTEIGTASGNVVPVTFAVHEPQDPVKYLDANGKEQTCESYYHITDESETIGGWLVVEGKVTVDWALDFPEDTHIILCDGAELNVKGLEAKLDDTTDPPSSPNLTIYAQSTGGNMGKLVSKKTDRFHGNISADTLTINGGVIEAEGDNVGLAGGTSVIINGGKVTCTGNYGIVAYSVMINGGTVTTAGNSACIYAIGGELTIADGLAVIEGDDEASARPVADPSTWKPSKKWARVTAAEPEPEPEPTPTGTKEMYRLYNPNSGEHFFTSSAAERDNVKAAGWTYEGVGWVAPADGAPVYRLYNENGGEHHFTTSKNEHDVLVGLGWKDEGIGWRTAGSDGVPVYRQYNPNAFANNHNFTVSTNERDTLLGLGWKDENIAWYGARVLK